MGIGALQICWPVVKALGVSFMKAEISFLKWLLTNSQMHAM